MATERDIYSRLFEKAVFPLLDKANGTSIAPKLAELLANEKKPADRLAYEQRSKLDRAVSRVEKSSTFYQQFWQTAPADRRLPSKFEALDGLPVITKDDLRGVDGSFPEAGFKGRALVTRTSGSTGEPMVFKRCMEQESWFWALRFRMWNWAGYQPGDRYLEINLNPRVAWKKRLQDRLLRCNYLTFNADNQDSARIIDALRRHDVRMINGFSSSLYVLARYMLDNGIENPGVTGITSTGDGLYPTYRETIEEAFGVRVLDYYGAGGEGFHVASQCPHSGERYHIHPENAVIELLDSNGPVEPGVPGRVVLTQFDNHAMPLVRYELGDVAIASDHKEICECGRTLPFLESVEGRVPDLIVSNSGGFLVPHFFVVLFKSLEGVRFYQIRQDEVGHAEVRMVGHDGVLRADVERRVTQAFGEATNNSMDLTFTWTDDIPLTGAGKRRLVISSVSADVLGAAQRRPAVGAE